MVLAQAGIAGGAVHALTGQLEQAGVQVAHHGDQPPHLVPRGGAARDRAPVEGLVGRRARGGETHGARADDVHSGVAAESPRSVWGFH